MRSHRHHGIKAQTILELVFVTMTLVMLFSLSFLMISLFEISQKQTMLARTQAFIELGNYADYGYKRHGEDDVKNQESQLVFVLGEDNPGTRVDLKELDAFKKMLEGELEINVTSSVRSDPSWDNYRFPRRLTRLFVRENGEDLISFPLEQTISIAHNRSLKLNQDFGERKDIGQYSGSVHYISVQELNKVLASAPIGEGLVDNTEFVQDLLRKIAEEDSSLSEEALALQKNVNLLDSIEGGAQAALISLALQLAMQYGFQQLSSAFNDISAEASSVGMSSTGTDGVSGTLVQGGGFGGAVAGSGGGFNFGFPSFNLIEGATLHNFGQMMTFSSQVLNTINLGANLAGKNIKGLGLAAAVTGGLGGISSGIYSLQNFKEAGGFINNGLSSEFFGGLQQISGGAGAIAGYFDPTAGRVFGITSSGLGLAAGAVSLGENWSTWSSQAGGVWKQISGVGGLASQAGGFVGGIAPGSSVAQGLGLAGSALGTLGGVGSFAVDFQTGEYDGKLFESMAVTGGLVASASGVGATVAQMSGDKDLAEKFSYGMIGGGALAVTGTVGILGKAVVNGIAKLGEAAASGIAQSGQKSNRDFQASGKSDSEGPQFNKLPETPKTNLEKINDALNFAAAVNFIAAQGFAAALEAKGADGVRESIAKAPQTGVGSVDQVISDLKSLDVESVTSQMTESQAIRFSEYMQSFQNSLAYIQERTQQGELPDQAIVQRGYEASRRAQAILDAQRGLPPEGTPERARYDQAQHRQNMQKIEQANREYRDLFQEDAGVISLMLQSERDIDGKKIIVASKERQNLLEEKGKEAADRIREHREKYYEEDSYYFIRLKKAEHAWRNMDFFSPKEALQQIKTALEANEKKYRETKMRLVDRLQACGSAHGC